jgi:chromosome segregation ATPase
MIDDNNPTADLTDRELLQAILQRLGALETLVDDRLKDTRPLWQGINQRLERIEEGQKDAVNRLDRIERRLDQLALDVLDVRADQRRLDGRMDDLERRPN